MVAEKLKKKFAASMNMRLGWATPPLQATLAMAWAYVAHRRLAFRGWTSVGKLSGATLFIVVSLGCLDSQFLMERLAHGLYLGAWVLASSLKFGLVRRLVWPVRLHRVG